MAQHLAVYRAHAPGFENAYIMLSAPQLGVHHARRLVGVGRVTRKDWTEGLPRPDEIGVSPSLSPKFPLISVPYGCLVPRDIEGLLVAGRHISCDPSSHSFLREIPQCWLTGQAAGAAAALAAGRGCVPRAPIAELRAILLRQGAWLRPSPAGQVEAAKSRRRTPSIEHRFVVAEKDAESFGSPAEPRICLTAELGSSKSGRG